jgi:glutamyl-tRNA synthetase
MGYLPEAMRNYLLRLGWAHGDDEIISTDQAIAWFDLDGVGRSPARFDFAKLDNLNGHYIRESDDAALVADIAPRLEAMLGAPLDDAARHRLEAGMPGLKPRAKTLIELAENARFYVAPRPLAVTPEAEKLLAGEARGRLARLARRLDELTAWDEPSLETALRDFAAAEEVKLGQIAQPLRAALSGSKTSPGIFDIMVVLGRAETLGRIADQAQTR